MLVTRTGNALRLAAVSAGAARAGLTPGMTLADARARCPGIAVRPHDPAADARTLDRLVTDMARFSPMVTPDPPDGLILDVTGCAHLFGGEAAMARQVADSAGYTARHALGANAVAARALARHGGGTDDVRALPTAALELPEDALMALRRAGLHTIGDLARRPMNTLAARFGEQAVLRLRQILGEAASPIAPHPPEEPVRAAARFAEPVIRTEDALDVIEDLLAQAAATMEARHLGGRRFVATFHRGDGNRRRLSVETGRPVRDPAIVLRLLRERIDTLTDPIDPGFGFDAITLAVPRLEPLAPRQSPLDKQARAAGDGADALIDRLIVRLGKENVSRLVPCDTHIPERAQHPAPVTDAAASPWPDPASQPPRPLWLFDPPQDIEVIADVPDGPPQRFRWQGRLRDVRLSEGPERIAAEWWRRERGHLPGEGGLTRDYYRIEDADGRRYWVFRHGLFVEREHPRWYLHGLFP